jgi:hypothetical protein
MPSRAIALLVGVLFIFSALVLLVVTAHAVQSKTHRDSCRLPEGKEKLVGSANSYIEKFSEQNRRLPTTKEFAIWSREESEYKLDFKSYDFILSTSDFPDDLLAKIGKPSAEAYSLTFRDDAGIVAFASWNNSKENCYVLGSTADENFQHLKSIIELAAIALALSGGAAFSLRYAFRSPATQK